MHLGENDSLGQVFTIRCHISQHHDPRQPQVATAAAQVVHHCREPTEVHDDLGQLEEHRRFAHRVVRTLSERRKARLTYLWRVFHHLPQQRGDVFPDVLVWISEGGDRRREDLGHNHYLCQAGRVFADLAEGGEHLPLRGDKQLLELSQEKINSYLKFILF